jgi:hypothetical protein
MGFVVNKVGQVWFPLPIILLNDLFHSSIFRGWHNGALMVQVKRDSVASNPRSKIKIAIKYAALNFVIQSNQ